MMDIDLKATLVQFGESYYPGIIQQSSHLEPLIEAIFPAPPTSASEVPQMLADYFPAMLLRRAKDFALYVGSGQFEIGQVAYDDPALDAEYQIIHGAMIASSLRESLEWLIKVLESNGPPTPPLPGDRATTPPYILHELALCLNQLRHDLATQVDISNTGSSGPSATADKRAAWLEKALQSSTDTAQTGADAFMIQDALMMFSEFSDVMQQAME